MGSINFPEDMPEGTRSRLTEFVKAAEPGKTVFHTPDSIAYHVAPVYHRESIEKGGLKKAKPLSGRPAGVYIDSDAPRIAANGREHNGRRAVNYGGDIYAARVPGNADAIGYDFDEDEEYVKRNIPRKDVIRIGHRAPFELGNAAHYEKEEDCADCANYWGKLKQDDPEKHQRQWQLHQEQSKAGMFGAFSA